jgi:hypothetical protein
MGLFDGYFDAEQFQDSGGLLGRLLSLQQQQGQYQSAAGFDSQVAANGQASSEPQISALLPTLRPTLPTNGPAASPPTPDYGQTQNIPIGNDYQMPQFGRADVSLPAQQPPDLGDRLSAGFQNWAHTPVGNPFAAFANGIAGMSSGQRTDAAGLVSSQIRMPASPGLGDRLSAGFQSWAHTPVGNPMAALTNGITGLSSGQRSDAAGVARQILQPRIDSSGNPQQDLSSQYQALRPILGDENAMLAIVHPEFGRTLMTQALARQAKSGKADGADPAGGGQPSLGNEASSIAGGQPTGLRKAGYLETPTNPNQAFGELLDIQQSNPPNAVGGEDYLSGVRDGNITYNRDGSLDVRNGTIVTVSTKNGRAKTVTMTNTDVAHIDAKTGEVVIQKTPLGDGI